MIFHYNQKLCEITHVRNINTNTLYRLRFLLLYIYAYSEMQIHTISFINMNIICNKAFQQRNILRYVKLVIILETLWDVGQFMNSDKTKGCQIIHIEVYLYFLIHNYY